METNDSGATSGGPTRPLLRGLVHPLQQRAWLQEERPRRLQAIEDALFSGGGLPRELCSIIVDYDRPCLHFCWEPVWSSEFDAAASTPRSLAAAAVLATSSAVTIADNVGEWVAEDEEEDEDSEESTAVAVVCGAGTSGPSRQSQCGGLSPFVSAGAPWPACEHGAMLFLLQLRLRDLPGGLGAVLLRTQPAPAPPLSSALLQLFGCMYDNCCWLYKNGVVRLIDVDDHVHATAAATTTAGAVVGHTSKRALHNSSNSSSSSSSDAAQPSDDRKVKARVDMQPRSASSAAAASFSFPTFSSVAAGPACISPGVLAVLPTSGHAPPLLLRGWLRSADYPSDESPGGYNEDPALRTDFRPERLWDDVTPRCGPQWYRPAVGVALTAAATVLATAPAYPSPGSFSPRNVDRRWDLTTRGQWSNIILCGFHRMLVGGHPGCSGYCRKSCGIQTALLLEFGVCGTGSDADDSALLTTPLDFGTRVGSLELCPRCGDMQLGWGER